MNVKLLIFVFFAPIQAKIDGFKPQKSIMVAPITDKNFNTFIKSHDFVLLLFSASWCSKCEKMFSDFEFAAHEAIRNDPAVFFGEVICDKSGGKTCEKEEISQLPSMKFYKYGKYSDFFNYYHRDNIAYFALRLVSVNVEELNTTEQLKTYLNTTTYGVVGFFGKDSALKIAYFKVANILFDRFDFAVTPTKNLLNNQGTTECVRVYKPWYMRNDFERDHNVYKNPGNAEKLRKFLLRNFHGLVGFRRLENDKEFKKPLLVIYYDFDFKNNYDSSMYYRQEVLKIAVKYKKEKVNFAISNSEEYKQILNERFAVKTRRNEPVITIEKDYNKRYIMQEEFNIENLDNFVTNFLNNNLNPTVKSSIFTRTDSTILEVTFNTFRNEIIKSKPDVFLEIYDPKCRVSRKVRKPFQEVSEILKNQILFASLDATMNDVPNIVKISSTPTFYYLRKEEDRKGMRKVKTFKFFGSRNIKTFLKFISLHSRKELTIPIKHKDEL